LNAEAAKDAKKDSSFFAAFAAFAFHDNTGLVGTSARIHTQKEGLST
jgi:hypothetical protein